MSVEEGEVLWTPSPDSIEASRYTHFVKWLGDEGRHSYSDYRALHAWSVKDPAGFWGAIWDYFDIQSSTRHTEVVGERRMPGTEWFKGARVNYAEHIGARG